MRRDLRWCCKNRVFRIILDRLRAVWSLWVDVRRHLTRSVHHILSRLYWLLWRWMGMIHRHRIVLLHRESLLWIICRDCGRNARYAILDGLE